MIKEAVVRFMRKDYKVKYELDEEGVTLTKISHKGVVLIFNSPIRDRYLYKEICRMEGVKACRT